MNNSRSTDTRTREDVAPVDPGALGFTKVGYTINESVELTSICRTSLYDAIKRGDLKIAKLGKRTIILACDLAEYLNTLRVEPKRAIIVGEISRQPTSTSSSPVRREGNRLQRSWPLYLRNVHVGDLEVDGKGGIAAYSIGPQGRTKIGTFRTRLQAEGAIRGVRT